VKKGTDMSVVLWVAQGLLVLLFLFSGSRKLLLSRARIVEQIQSLVDLPLWSIRLIGILEVAGALGLVLPMVTGIATWLTPLAAAGLVLTMVGAMLLHALRREPREMLVNFVILAFAVFVAWGRFSLITTFV
jgi:uncharacterized membrane protein